MSKKKAKLRGEEKTERSISFFNWFITLIVSLIPGLNILFFILTAACARTASKRHYGVAALVLTLLLLAALSIALFWFSDQMVEFFKTVLAESKA